MLVAALFLSILLFRYAEGNDPLPKESLQMHPDTVLVLWGTRHGNRQPDLFLDENPRTWGFEGTSELTTFGKRQAYGLGRELRAFMGYNKVDMNYNRTQVKYWSSSASRCQMTLQVALAGFHEPVDWADWNQAKHDFWSPIPYNIDDHLLRMYNVDDCPESDNAWRPISQDTLPEMVARSQSSIDLRQYCENNTKWNMTNLGNMADLADNLIEIDLYGAKYPDWIQYPTLPGYDFQRIRKEILSFAEIHQNACAEYAPCGNLMGGYWLQNLLDAIKTAQSGEGPTVIGYASHTEVTLSVMRLMGIDKDELTTSAGFVLELRLKPQPLIRLLNHDPDPIDRHAKYMDDLVAKSDPNGWIPLDNFLAIVQSRAIPDWKKACKTISGCSKSSSTSSLSFLFTLSLLFIHTLF